MPLQAAPAFDPGIDETIGLLGGSGTFRSPVVSRLDAHDLLSRGLPVRSLNALVDGLPFLVSGSDLLEKVVGISRRTYQRRRDQRDQTLSPEQSSRIWKFAEIVARATAILGSQKSALDWLMQPAIGLDQRRPIDLIGTAAGQELVEDHLTRIEYGVYS